MTDGVRPSAPRTPTIRPVVRAPHLSVSVAEQLLALITEGEFGPGERLPSEVDLARDFAVSRPSVREALAALQFAGHVESRRGFGTIVVRGRPSSAAQAGADNRRGRRPRRVLRTLVEAVDLLETRLLLEPEALAVAAADPDRRALDEARALISGMRTAVDEPQLRTSSDLRIHRALLRTCRNVVLRESASELLDLAADPLLLVSRTQAWASRDLPHHWADQHDTVCDAIAAGQADAVHAAASAHLASVTDLLCAAVTAGGSPALVERMGAIARRGPAPHPADQASIPDESSEAGHG